MHCVRCLFVCLHALCSYACLCIGANGIDYHKLVRDFGSTEVLHTYMNRMTIADTMHDTDMRDVDVTCPIQH